MKPANILMEGENSWEIKIADFGFSCFFDAKNQMDTILGTPPYKAIELIEEKPYDERVDIWAVGIMAYIMLVGVHPFYNGRNKADLHKAVIENELTFKDD